jgi:hypothetical protein
MTWPPGKSTMSRRSDRSNSRRWRLSGRTAAAPTRGRRAASPSSTSRRRPRRRRSSRRAGGARPQPPRATGLRHRRHRRRPGLADHQPARRRRPRLPDQHRAAGAGAARAGRPQRRRSPRPDHRPRPPSTRTGSTWGNRFLESRPRLNDDLSELWRTPATESLKENMATAFGLASLKPSELSGVSDYQLDSRSRPTRRERQPRLSPRLPRPRRQRRSLSAAPARVSWRRQPGGCPTASRRRSRGPCPAGSRGG